MLETGNWKLEIRSDTAEFLFFSFQFPPFSNPFLPTHYAYAK